MKNRMAAVFLAALLGLLPPAGALAAGSEERAELDSQLERAFTDYQTMGACVALIENGQVTYTYCYGTRTNRGEAVTPDCGFQVGSISKMVAGIGLMMLVEQGRAELDEELGEILGLPVRSPYYPDTHVTLRQLMTHSAGLRDSAYYDEAIAGKGYTLDELFESDKVSSLFHQNVKPGEKSVYSNFGGGLTGHLIKTISGQTLDAYMKEKVFDPLGITAAFQARLLPADMPLCDIYFMPQRQLAKALREDEPAMNPDGETRDYCFSAGKLIISAPDLAKLLIVLCDGGVYQDVRLLREDTVREMRTPQNARRSVRCDSNRGLFMNIITDDQAQDRTVYGHGGKAYGMLCAAYFDPKDRTGVVMLTNGCRNRKVYNNVGMLGRRVMNLVYEALEQSGYQAEDPFAVE